MANESFFRLGRMKRRESHHSDSLLTYCIEINPMPWVTDMLTLSHTEKGIVIDLIMMSWMWGSIPADTAELSKLCGASKADFAAAWPSISRFFMRAEDGERLVEITSIRQIESGQVSWSKVAYDEVYERDGGLCRYCRSTETLSIDHVIPRCRGGSDDAANLVVACRTCNSSKGGRTPEEAGMVLLPVDR